MYCSLSVCLIVQWKIIQQTGFLITGVFHFLYPLFSLETTVLASNFEVTGGGVWFSS